MSVIDNTKLELAIKASQKSSKPMSYLRYSIDQIATRMSTFQQWDEAEHDEYREEMRRQAIADMTEGYQNFVVDKGYNAFRYMSTIAWVSFCKTAKKYNPDFQPKNKTI